MRKYCKHFLLTGACFCFALAVASSFRPNGLLSFCVSTVFCVIDLCGFFVIRRLDAQIRAGRNWPMKDQRCFKCGKGAGDHNATTSACPIGRKHRTYGYCQFSLTDSFTKRSDVLPTQAPAEKSIVVQSQAWRSTYDAPPFLPD